MTRRRGEDRGGSVNTYSHGKENAAVLRKLKSERGFNMAELLIVIAIVVALAAVTFIAVWNHQRSLKQLEFDGIAKEIFVAAQNHLTAADGQGYLGRTVPDNSNGAMGAKEDLTRGPEPEIFYFIVGGTGSGYTAPGDETSLLNLMLPFGSIDETVRAGGSYVIRYQTEPAQILDVFYSPRDGVRFGHTYLDSEYNTLINEYRDYRDANQDDAIVSKKAERRNYNGAVLGYYGGVEAVSIKKDPILPPTIEVFNKDKLYVTVENPNPVGSPGMIQLKLIVTGKTSGQSKEIPLVTATSVVSNDFVDVGIIYTPDNGATFTVYLDDITSPNANFKFLFGDYKPEASSVGNGFVGGKLFPGEDIEIKAVAFSNALLSNIAESTAKTTNSLFSDDTDVDGKVAGIASIRHLENLSPVISGIPDDPVGSSVTVSFKTAEQSTDLSWKTFETNTGGIGSTSIYVDSNASVYIPHTAAGKYMPVNPPVSFGYDGNAYSISDIEVNITDNSYTETGNAGLFGTLRNGYVRDVELIDFDIKTEKGYAGALCGEAQGIYTPTDVFDPTRVSGVVAHNTTTSSDSNLGVTGLKSVGGLIGETDGTIVTASAAALYVNSTGDSAGGLIGTALGGSVNLSYSGGHTDQGDYLSTTENAARVNVIGASSAGGLVGKAQGLSVSNSYSTCSAKGVNTGGLIGTAEERTVGSVTTYTSVNGSYSTGLVLGTGNVGAFIGSSTSVAGGSTDQDQTKNYYFSIINEGVGAFGESSSSTLTAAAFDSDVATYNSFAFSGDYRSRDTKAPYAFAYDDYLVYEFGGRTDMPTLDVLYAKAGSAEEWVKSLPDYLKSGTTVKHWGDWPSPETKVINEKEPTTP